VLPPLRLHEADMVLMINAPEIAARYPNMTLDVVRQLLHETREQGHSKPLTPGERVTQARTHRSKSTTYRFEHPGRVFRTAVSISPLERTLLPPQSESV